MYVFVHFFNDIIDSLPLIGGGGNGNPLQYSCLGNSMDRGSWRDSSPRGCKRVGHELAAKQQQHSNLKHIN